MGHLNAAMHAVIAAEPIEAKVRTAQKAGRIGARGQDAIFDEAMMLSVITETELAQWKRARVLTRDVVRVDDFDKNFGLAVVEPASWQHTMAAEQPWPNRFMWSTAHARHS